MINDIVNEPDRNDYKCSDKMQQNSENSVNKSETLMFKDCRQLAIMYEQKFIDVIIKFTEIELHQRNLKRDDNYNTIKNMTENYFKSQYIVRETDEI
jgi:hypothetical protein